LFHDGHHRWDDPAIGPQVEELLPAGIAPIRWEAQIPLHKNQRPFPNPLTRDMVEIEVAASRAVSVSGKRGSHAPGIKAQIARVASPGPQSDDGA